MITFLSTLSIGEGVATVWMQGQVSRATQGAKAEAEGV